MSTHLLQTTILKEDLLNIDLSKYANAVAAIHRYLEETEGELTGWLNAPLKDNRNLMDSIINVSNEIKMNANVLVVIGVGGSYLGARAVQDALSPYFAINNNGIEVVYVGQNMSGAYIHQLIENLEGKELYINVISKSGSTLESALAFRVFRHYMEKRYGEESNKRIIVTTDIEKGLLKGIAETHNYRQFIIPSNIGGRYSILTPVGLLPMAVAGVDIEQLLHGAKVAAIELKEESIEKNEAYRYAAIRHVMYSKGYHVELLASFEPSLKNFHEWWKQLFGESEGKEKRGLFPVSINYSTDLHSLGQFVQDGSPLLFETFLHFHEITDDYHIPVDERNEDKLNYLSNLTFNEINSIAKEGTIAAHSEGGVPIIQLELERLDEFNLGYLIYFFMKACAMSAYLLEVNPFDQPGVEAYKRKMYELLEGEKVK